MAQNRVEQADFTFVKGLITEAGPFVFPPDACTDCDNIMFNINGSFQRRLGIDYESGYSLFSKAVASTDAIGLHDWFDVNGDSTVKFQVTQVGSMLYFYTHTVPISANKKSFSIDLTAHKISTATTAQVAGDRVDTAYGRGVFFVVGQYLDPFYITYTAATDTIGETSYVIYERDLVGVEDSLAVGTHPATNSNEHNYNLLNQGWSASLISSYYTQRGNTYPANADIAHDGYFTDPTTGKKSWHSDDIVNTGTGNTPAPKGQFTYNVFDTTTAVGLAGNTTNPLPVVEALRPRSVAFFAGRVWYGGTPSARLGSKVHFSKIIEGTKDFGLCYQEADPTAESINELIESDGGSISIPALGATIKMQVVGTKLVLFTSVGVWEIGGGDSEYFKATSYAVRQTTTIGCSSPASIIMVEGAPYFAAYQGLFTLTQDKVTGYLTPQSLTDATIKTLFATIPDANKNYLAAAYDDILKRIYFLYATDASYTYKYNKFLLLDMRLGSFSTNTLTVSPVYVMGIGASKGYSDAVNKIRFFTFATGDKITFSTLRNTSWLDWYTYDLIGVDSPAYIITGLKTGGDVMRRKQVPYLFVYLKRTETQWISSGADSATLSPPSSCLVQARWDFADSTANGKYTTAFQVYRHLRIAAAPTSLPATFDPGYNIVVTKNKVRGSGKTLQLKFYSEAGKDMYMYGWSFPLGGSSEV